MDRERRFKITVNAGCGTNGEEYIFTFKGPKGAPIGVVYDACFAVLSNITNEINKHTNMVSPKKPAVKSENLK